MLNNEIMMQSFGAHGENIKGNKARKIYRGHITMSFIVNQVRIFKLYRIPCKRIHKRKSRSGGNNELDLRQG